MNPGAYKPLTLTFVEYRSGDFIGFILAWFSMLPILLFISLVTLIVFRRDLTTIFCFIGFLFTEAINYILKNVIRQPRPMLDRHTSRGSFSKYGMPSDHSQISFYLATFVILLVIFRYHLNSGRFSQFLVKAMLVSGSFLCAGLVAFSRIYLEYHTIEQVVVGSIVGILLGIAWFFLVHRVFSQYFHFITTWRLSEFFMIRDYSNIPNVLFFQYSAERNEANIRRKIKK